MTHFYQIFYAQLDNRVVMLLRKLKTDIIFDLIYMYKKMRKLLQRVVKLTCAIMDG